MGVVRKYVNTLIENIVLKGRRIEESLKEGNVRHGGIVRFDDKNSDVFHAETFHEKNIAEFNVLKQAYQDDRNLGKLSAMDPNKQKTSNYFSDNPIHFKEHSLIKKDAALRLNYNRTIMP